MSASGLDRHIVDEMFGEEFLAGVGKRMHPHASFKMGFRYTRKMRHAGVY